MQIFLSTAWVRNDIEKLIEILPIIDGIEINSIGNREFFEKLYLIKEKYNISISSIHASAGPHKDTENAYYLPDIASLDEELRVTDVKALSLTAEWAKKIGCSRIVLHGGQVYNSELKEMFLFYKKFFLNNRISNKTIKNLKRDIIRLRSELAHKHIVKLIKSLTEICSKYLDIKFFIETRLHYYEIPIPEEAEYVLKNIPLNNLGYWNDIGHAYIEDRLGFIDFNRWKSDFLLGRCGGLHVHDIDGNLKDHYPPGYGNAPLKHLLRRFPKNIPWVLEINSRHTLEEVKRGIENYKTLLKVIYSG